MVPLTEDEPQAADERATTGAHLRSELYGIVERTSQRTAVRRPATGEHDPMSLESVPVELDVAEASLDAVSAMLETVEGEGVLPLLQRVARLRAMTEALEAAAIHRMEETRAGVDAGFRNSSSAVKSVTKSTGAEASRRVGVAQKVRDLPLTWAAWESGFITESHVARLASAASGHRREQFLEVEEALVEAALRLPYPKFCTVVAHFELMTEPDLDDADDEERAKRSAELRRSRRERGGGTLEAKLDAEGYATVSKTLREIERELFDADWAEAEERLGEGNVTIDDLNRTSTQRRADALVEMSKRAAAVPAGAKKPRPSVVVHISHEAFEAEIKRRVGAAFKYPANFSAELDDGTPISPGRALALAVEGEVRRLVFDGPDIRTRFGRSKRFADGALREMIMARDRHCQAPGCDVPAWECDVDHIIDWQHDGETNGDELEAKCRWHNGNKSQFEIFTDPVTGAVAWRRRAA